MVAPTPKPLPIPTKESAISALLSHPDMWKTVLLILGIIVGVLLLVGLVYLIYKKFFKKKALPAEEKKPEAEAPKAEAVEEKKPVKEKEPKLRWWHRYFYRKDAEITGTFRENMRRLKGRLSYLENLYDLPFFVLLGSKGVGKTALMSSVDLDFPFGLPAVDELAYPCQFWTTKQGVVLEVRGYQEANESHAFLSYKEDFLAIIRQMMKYRRRRMVDGIVLAFSYPELQTCKTADSLEIEQRLEKELRYQVGTIRQYSRFHLPVYIVVTQADLMPGFHALLQNLPKTGLTGMFGWSSPRPFGDRYDASALDEAFSYIRTVVRKLEFELFAKRDQISNAPDLLKVEQSLLEVQNWTQFCTNRVLQIETYGEKPFTLRGVYFTGSLEDRVQQEEGFLPKVFFSRDLFLEKIFKESALARPIEEVERRAKSPYLNARNLFIVGACVIPIGWIMGYRSLTVKIDQLIPVLQQEVNYLELLQNFPSYVESQSNAASNFLIWQKEWNSLQPLIRLFFSFNVNLRTLYLPPSWLSPLNYTIRLPQRSAAINLLLRAMYVTLFLKIQTLLLPADVDYPARLTANNLGDYLQFQPLVDFVSQSIQLEQMVNLYDQLDVSYSDTAFRNLINYTLGSGTDALLEIDRITLRAIVRNLPKKRLNIYQYNAALSQKLQILSSAMGGYLVDHWPLQDSVDEVSNGLADFDAGTATLSDVKNMARNIATINYIFNTVGSVAKGEAVRGLLIVTLKNFDQALNAAAKSGLFSPELCQTQIVAEHSALRSEMKDVAEYTNPTIGQFLLYDPEKDQLEMSPRLVDLQTVVNTIVSYQFPDLPASWVLQPYPATSTIFEWQASGLSVAKNLVTKLSNFQEIVDAVHGKGYQALLSAFSNQIVDNAVNVAISNSYVLFDPTSALGEDQASALNAEVKNINENASLVASTVDLIRKLQLSKSLSRITDLVNIQSMQLLISANNQLEADQLYLPINGNFDWWKGGNDLAYQAYNVATDKDLAYYLSVQRARLQYLLSSYAMTGLQLQKLLNVAAGKNVVAGLSQQASVVQRWQDISTALNQYAQKATTNTLSALEKFISVDLNQMNVTDCEKNTTLNPTTDYFSQTENRLKMLLRTHCQTLAQTESISAYDRVVQAFNQYLAGWFPFVPKSLTPTAPGVSYNTLVDFYSTFGNDLNTSRALLVAIKNPSMEDQARLDFLNNLADSLGFLLINQEKGGYQTPSYAYQVWFRVNRSEEVGGNQIAAWAFAGGPQTVTPLDKVNQGLWNYGENTQATFTWAKDSPYLPANVSADPSMYITPKAVAYTYSDDWSLLRMILTHQVPLPQMNGAQREKYSILLQYNTTVSPSTNPAVKSFASFIPDVRVYLGVSLLNAANDKPLAFPTFPYTAPSFLTLGRQYQYPVPPAPPPRTYSRYHTVPHPQPKVPPPALGWNTSHPGTQFAWNVSEKPVDPRESLHHMAETRQSSEIQ